MLCGDELKLEISKVYCILHLSPAIFWALAICASAIAFASEKDWTCYFSRQIFFVFIFASKQTLMFPANSLCLKITTIVSV